MGKGTDMARLENPDHAQLMDNFKEQLLLAMIIKAGGRYSIPVSAVDATGGWVLEVCVDEHQVFHFEAKRKA